MSPDTSFAALVKSRRVTLGLSQTALADLVGRSSSAVRGWERGSSSPTDENVVQTLAAVLGIDEKILRTSVGLPSEVTSEDLDSSGDTASSFFEEETVPQPDAPRAGDKDEAEGTEGGGPSPEVSVTDDQEVDAAFAGVPQRRESDSEVVAAQESEVVETLRGPDRRAEITSRSQQVAATEPAATVARPVTASTRTIPAGQMPPTIGRSYLDDPDQMTTYWVRTALTVAFFVFLLIVLLWALGKLGDSVGEVFDLFKAAS